MAASIETQRLISVSLGKIAQSRGQRGGINLHKNLLVATVLHKARTAYMMESYSYQQNLQRQKLQSEYSQQSHIVPPAAPLPTPVCSEQSRHEEVCQSSGESNLGQPTATLTVDESRAAVVPVSAIESEVCDSQELMSIQERECEVSQDKENAPPSISSENLDTEHTRPLSTDDHLSAATQLAHEAQVAAENLTISMKQNLTSASTTCNVLKRRRDNPSACTQENECPASKKARVSYESNISSPVSTGYHTDDSDSDSESEMILTDSPQITNLVSIFNSGFSGLCAVSSDSESDSSGYSSDLEISSSTHFTPLSKVRPETPSSFSRSEHLMCSSQVGRLESLPSAIILSA